LHVEWAELAGLHCDGTDVPVETAIWTAESNGGGVFHALIKDLRVRRELEIGLDQSQKVSDFVAGVADIITLADPSGLSYVSPACQATLRCEPDDLLGPFPFELIQPADREKIQAAYQQAFATDGTLVITFRFRGPRRRLRVVGGERTSNAPRDGNHRRSPGGVARRVEPNGTRAAARQRRLGTQGSQCETVRSLTPRTGDGARNRSEATRAIRSP
jgi:PAS domain-containing protein